MSQQPIYSYEAGEFDDVELEYFDDEVLATDEENLSQFYIFYNRHTYVFYCYKCQSLQDVWPKLIEFLKLKDEDIGHYDFKYNSDDVNITCSFENYIKRWGTIDIIQHEV